MLRGALGYMPRGHFARSVLLVTNDKQCARLKPEKRELFEQCHNRELILYDAAARYLKELKASGEEITPEGMAA